MIYENKHVTSDFQKKTAYLQKNEERKEKMKQRMIPQRVR